MSVVTFAIVVIVLVLLALTVALPYIVWRMFLHVRAIRAAVEHLADEVNRTLRL